MRARDAETLLADVGRRVAEIRRARGWTQSDLAERLELSDQYVRHVEGGRANLALRSIAKFAKVLGVDASELMRRPRSRKPRKPGRPRAGAA